jgi:hypothetical protein
MTRYAALVLGVLMLLAGSAHAAEPWEGHWAADPSWCGGETGIDEEAPVIMTAKRFEGLENSCAVIRIMRSKGTVTLSLDCWGEGVNYKERIELWLAGGKLQMQYLDRDNGVVTFHRCPLASTGRRRG